MKILRAIYTLCAAALLLSSCQDEEMIKQSGVKEGIPVTIDLTFSAVIPEQEQVGTRAITDPEYRVNDLYVLIFNANTRALKSDENGNPCCYSFNYSQLTTNGNKQSDETGTLVGELSNIKTTTGESVIYAIANVNNPPAEYEITEDIKSAITSVQSIDDLEDIVVNLRDNDANALDRLYETRYIMSGSLSCEITVSGISGSNDIPLKRTDSYITFTVDNNVTDTKCTSFNLLSYRIYNVPVGTSLVSLGDKNYDDEASDLYVNYWNVEEAMQTGGNTFSFYVPENIKKAKSSFNDYAARDVYVKNADGTNTETFQYAPDYGTYVVLHGIYEGTASTTQDIPGVDNEENALVRASVDYIIHLGNFGKDVTDFSNERNVHYTYTVHVKGVDDIIVEVETSGDDNPEEPEPGAEGDVFFRTGIFYNLDCHNEPVLMNFTAQEIKNVGAQADQYIQYWISSPFGDKEDNHWLHFVLNNNAGQLMPYPGDNACQFADNAGNGIYSANGITVMSLDGLMTALKDIVTNGTDSDYANDNGGISVTCFVNEYVYDGKSWGEYVNQSNREAYIFGRVTYSADKNSSTILTKYTISQRSIKTMDAYYDGIGLGIETVNETGDLPMGNPQSDDGAYPDSDELGLDNTLEMLATQTWWEDNAVNVSDAPWGYTAPGLDYYQTMGDDYEYAAYACLMRNRDENGDGKIDAGEVKWYLPALDQYAAIYAGSTALATEAQLYTQWNAAVKTHYLTSTWGTREENSRTVTGPWIIWAEEGYNTQVLPDADSDYDGDDSQNYLTERARPYRCIRNLSGEDANQRTGFYNYKKDTRVITINHQQDYRGYDNGSALSAHNQIERENRFYNQFKVANYYLSETYTASSARIGNPCRNYSEKDDNGKWRMPNQRELMAMYAAGVFDDLREQDENDGSGNRFVHCQTTYNFYDAADNNSKYGYGVQRTTEGNTVLLLIRDLNEEGYIRCVRDVE